MTTHQHSEITPLDLGEGLMAVEIWKSKSFIALVGTRTPEGKETKSRLDLQKAMFIDPLPANLNKNKIVDLVQLIIKL